VADETIFDDGTERSAGGSPILRLMNMKEDGSHTGYTFTPFFDEIEAHVSKHIGPVTTVLHEIVSGKVHLDVLIVEPTAIKPYRTFVTCGMSALPMTVPEGMNQFRHSELVIALPAEWDVDTEEGFYPVGTLKSLASLPHDHQTWIGFGHTIPNGDPAQPLAADTEMIGSIIGLPYLGGEAFITLKMGEERVNFWSMVPLYQSEMNFKLAHDADALFDLLDDAGVSELYDPRRLNVLPT